MVAGDNNQSYVARFHKAFGVDKIADPDNPNVAIADLRADLIGEEAEETRYELRLAAIIKDGKSVFFDRGKLAKELADLLVVAYGTAEVFGIDLDWAFKETMASNMTKLDSDGKPIYREDGKILKGPKYREPNMEMVVYGNSRSV